METNDLGKTLEALADNPAFDELAASKPDLSALDGVPFAVAVTNFEIAEQKIADEQSILHFKPRFVAFADTHRWKSTASAIAETQIGKFARDAYGDDVKLEKSEKADAKFFAWTSRDGRKIFAAVAGGVIYAGNDEGVLDECLKIRRGAAENLSKNEDLARAREKASGENNIAFGYVSTEGVAQISNFAAVSLAVGATDDGDARSFVAGAAPQAFQKTVREISWTAAKTEHGIEDKISISIDGETASVLSENLKIKLNAPTDSAEYLPSGVFSATRYNLENPLAAWRGLLFAVAKKTDERQTKILRLISGGLLEPYGITDAEMFLSAVDADVLTARIDEAGEKSFAVFTIKDVEKVKQSIAEINFKSPPEPIENAETWKSADGETIAAFAGNKLILGDAASVLNSLEAKRSGENFTRSQFFQKFSQSQTAAVTVAKDADAAEKVVEFLGEAKNENKKMTTIYLTETAFTEAGVERRNVSAFGLIGEILEALKN